ncbi:MAG: hypothetical protein WC119_01165 [Synergistaceae bacterium]
MKFNLTSYASKAKEGDIHNEKKLQRDHIASPESITQVQLEKDRVPEKEVIIEKLLDQKRLGGADKIIEKNLNDSKSSLHKHRNAKAYSGDINKIEEQRVSNNKDKFEKAKPASSTPSKKRWWDDLKASSKKKVVTAQAEEVEEMTFDEDTGWGRMEGLWNEEEGLSDTGIKSLPEDALVEELGADPLTVVEIRPVDSPIAKGLYIVLDINAEGSQMGLDELQEAAYNKVLSSGFGYLADTEGFTPDSFGQQGDQMVARLIGDEYCPRETADGDDLGTENPFSVSDLQRTEVEGVVLGTVAVDAEMMEMIKDMDDSEIIRNVKDAIAEAHSDVNVEDDGIDLDQLPQGVINFVGQAAVDKGGRPESWENVKGAPIASSDFDIVVLSEVTKKN